VTRRHFIWTATAAIIPSRAKTAISVPIHRVVDARLQCPPEMVRNFWSSIWPEAVGVFGAGGIQFVTTDGPGEVKRSAGDNPIFVGLRRGVINLVLTDHVPLNWDNARAVAGVSTIFDGYHICIVALRYAHLNQIPFLSINTCVHELLHVLLQDIYAQRAKWYQKGGREARIDWYATRLWLFHDGAAIRESARTYLDRFQLQRAGRA
jgi:hypothetical protein